jgi:ketosteroid isomerase-like protein
MTSIDPVKTWMDTFAQAVRDRRTDKGQKLVAENVIGFGTRTAVAKDRPSLIENQWTPVWYATRGFDFDYDDAVIQIHNDMAWVATTWTSELESDGPETGEKRSGRCTLILRKNRDGWKAIHTHFSVKPNTKDNW